MQLKLSPMLSKSIAEGIGTFAIVFVGCGAIRLGLPQPLVPLLFGAIVAAMIYATGHISGAHFNPAVTLGFAVAKRHPWNQVSIYWLGQFIGAIIAMVFLSQLVPTGHSYGATIPTITLIRAVAWESVLTFFLMFVITAVATDNRAVGMMAGLAIGITVMLDAYLGGSVTGASMNPARSLAPAIAERSLSTVWVYFLGPCIGSVLGALTYEAIRCDIKGDVLEKDAKGCC